MTTSLRTNCITIHIKEVAEMLRISEILSKREKKHGYIFTLRPNDFLRPKNCFDSLHRICKKADLLKKRRKRASEIFFRTCYKHYQLF